MEVLQEFVEEVAVVVADEALLSFRTTLFAFDRQLPFGTNVFEELDRAGRKLGSVRSPLLVCVSFATAGAMAADWLLLNSSKLGRDGSWDLMRSLICWVQPSWRIKSHIVLSSSPSKHTSVHLRDHLKGPTFSLLSRSRGTELRAALIMLQKGSTSRDVPMTITRSALGRSLEKRKKRLGRSSPKKVMSGFTKP